MRVDILSGLVQVGRCDLSTIPSRGDGLLFKGQAYIVREIMHNCDLNRVQLMCEAKGKPVPESRLTVPVVSEVVGESGTPEELPQSAIRRSPGRRNTATSGSATA